MRNLVIGLIGFSMPSFAFAGWGAIAYNSVTGMSAESHGYNSYSDASNAALRACGDCQIVTWEQNSCIALATGTHTYAVAYNKPTAGVAIQSAIIACGATCNWQLWACD